MNERMTADLVIQALFHATTGTSSKIQNTTARAKQKVTEYIESFITVSRNKKDWAIYHQQNSHNNAMQIHLLLNHTDFISDNTPQYKS